MAGKICMRNNSAIILSFPRKRESSVTKLDNISGINRFQVGTILIISVYITLMQTTAGFSQSIRSKVNEGNSQYNEEKYEEALNNYQDALLDDPKHDIVTFNQGDALYKLEKYENAIESYQKVIGSSDLKIESQAHYNIGNAYFKQDKLQESIESYIKALDLNPDDQDVKYNLELARAKLKEMADKQQQQPQQNGQQQQGDQQQQQGEGEENQEGEEEQQQSQTQEQQGDQPAGEEQGEEEQQQEGEALEESEDKMTKEDAERILDALKNDEQDMQKMRKPAGSRKRNVEKDW
jgi:tetratricopeptide (TPR) repeat protein